MKFPGLSVQGSAGLVNQADKFTWKPERAVMFPKYQKSAQQELNLLEFHGGGPPGGQQKLPNRDWCEKERVEKTSH